MAKPARTEGDHVPGGGGGGGRTSVAGWPGGILSRDGTGQDGTGQGGDRPGQWMWICRVGNSIMAVIGIITIIIITTRNFFYLKGTSSGGVGPTLIPQLIIRPR